MMSVQTPDPEKIRGMFSQIASRYDLANTVLSAGIHHLWRKRVVAWSGARPGHRVLDCATGTGDLAIEFARATASTFAEASSLGEQNFRAAVLGTDFCAEMLESAPAKAQRAGVLIDFETADVTKLPYADSSFDIASIAFGIRNVGDRVAAIRELSRVVKPGGCVMVLEFGQPQSPMVGRAFDFYSKRVLPRIGGILTGRPEAYQYLQDSSAQFPCGDEFARSMQENGRFESVEWRALSLGIAYMYKAVRNAD